MKAGASKDKTGVSEKAGNARSGQEREVDRLVLVCVGVPILLLLAYFGAWAFDTFMVARSCRSATGMVFSPEDCSRAASLIPATLMTAAYGWSCVAFFVFVAARKWGGVIAMLLVIGLLMTAHVGVSILDWYMS